MKSPKKVKKRKTTIAVYWNSHISLYTGITEFFLIRFYGARMVELEKRWSEFLLEKEALSKKRWEEDKKKNIEKIELELLDTTNSWFSKRKKALKEKLKEEKSREFLGLSEYSKNIISIGFISKLGGILVSTGDKTEIYEV